jgi:4-hydroxy-4-methyl-2-oxoglutarate aldolase
MERKELLELFEPLRLTDVRDGMDWNGLHFTGSAGPDIRPVWRTKIVGFAKTLRYVPTDKTIPTMTPDEYTRYAYDYWYGEVTKITDPFEIEDGDVVCVDASNTNVGILGSNNTLDWIARGARGVVTNGGIRDTDEVIHQKTPVWSRYISQTMNQGRVEYAGAAMPVDIGGCLVRPGDIIVADGDGVVCVPIEHAESVAKYARQEWENDRKGRGRIYERLGWEKDDTVD